jgi:protein-S-isoprenylcysteine O-methyltransferase Ste14
MRILGKRLRPRAFLMYVFSAGLVLSARPTAASLAAGLATIAAGEVLRLWATGYLHKTESLTVAGPYAYVRHPLYLGTLLIGTGFALIANTPLGYALWMLGTVGYFAYYLPYKSRIEGARLEALFGDDYRRYTAAVPEIFPRLHAYVPLGGHPEGGARWTGVRFEDNHETGVALAVGFGVAAMLLRWATL